MTISFCLGCKHWVLCRPKPYSSSYGLRDKFHYCGKFVEYSIKKRRELCNGKYWEEKER